MSPPSPNIELTQTPDVTVELVGTVIIQQGYALTYTHQQLIPLAIWTVNHNLGFQPDTEILSGGGEKIMAEVIHTSLNQCLIYWSSPKSGIVRCT